MESSEGSHESGEIQAGNVNVDSNGEEQDENREAEEMEQDEIDREYEVNVEV